MVNRGIDAVTPSVSFYFLMENKRKETVKRQLLPKKSRSWNLSVRRICPRVPTSRIIGNRVSEVTSLSPSPSPKEERREKEGRTVHRPVAHHILPLLSSPLVWSWGPRRRWEGYGCAWPWVNLISGKKMAIEIKFLHGGELLDEPSHRSPSCLASSFQSTVNRD